MNPYDAINAADTTNMQAGGQSWMDDAGDALTKGVGAAVVSGMASVYNTGVAAVNFFGADADKIDVAKQLTDYDQNWGDYYKQHQGVIDTAGFLATSLIPGSLAIKGLNLMRSGEAFGAFSTALNYTRVAQTNALERALQVAASPEGTVFTRLNKDFLGSLAWGSADAVIQNAAFMTGVAATMNQSPIMEGQSLKDITHDILVDSLGGGALFGTVGGLLGNKVFKDAANLVTATGRKYDPVFADAIGDLAVPDSDKAYSIMYAASKLPKAVASTDTSIPFSYSSPLGKRTVNLDTNALFSKTLQASQAKGLQDFESAVTNNLATDVSAGKPFAKSMLSLIQEGRSSGLSDYEINSRLGDHLFGLDSIEPLGDRLPTLSDDSITYLNLGKDVAAPQTMKQRYEGLFSKEPQFGSIRARILTDPGELQSAVLGQNDGQFLTQSDAWKAGNDIAFKPDGTWAINPNSKKLRIAPEPELLPTFYNTQLNQVMDTVAPTVADVATADSPLVLKGNTVRSGENSFTFSVTAGLSSDADSVEQTARGLWADSLPKVKGSVNFNDFHLLDRMSRDKLTIDPTTTVQLKAGDDIPWKDLGNFDQWVQQNKLDFLKTAFTEANPGSLDIQKLALQVNATPEWVQNAIASKFQNLATDNAPSLTQGMQRDLSQYANRENVVLNYKKPQGLQVDYQGNKVQPSLIPSVAADGTHFLAQGDTGFVTGQLAYQYRKQLATQALETAVAAGFGSEDYARFIGMDADGAASLANRIGAGPGLVSSADANYGNKLAVIMQYTGKQVNEVSNKWASAALTSLQPMIQRLVNSPTDMAELVAVRQRVMTGDTKWYLMGTEHGLDGSYMVDRVLANDPKFKGPGQLSAAVSAGATDGSQKAYHINSDLVSDFYKQHQALIGDVLNKKQALVNAQGFTSNIDPQVMYMPPVDTRAVPYFAYIKPQSGVVLGSDGTGMITAKTSDELARKIASVDTTKYQVFTRDQNEAFFKAKGDYEYSRAINDIGLDHMATREGKLNNFMPSFNAEQTLSDFLNFHNKQQTGLVRDLVSSKYAQQFSELQRLSDQYTATQSSKVGLINKFMERANNDPYGDYMRTALDISKKSEFTILQQTNDFIDSLGTRAYGALNSAMGNAQKGVIPWDEANQVLTRYGLGGVYNGLEDYMRTQTLPDRNLIKEGISKINMALSTLTLRWDMAHSIIHTISSSVMLGHELSSIQNSIRDNPELVGKLADLTSVGVPGQNYAVPSSLKLIFGAVKSFWGDDKQALLDRMHSTGLINDTMSKYHEMISDVSVGSNILSSDFAKKAGAWTDKIAAGFGNTWAEQFTKFVSGKVMMDMTQPLVDAGRMSVNEQNAYMQIFANRTGGNYLTSQRPILFQGTLGSAVGLFQTYHFNMLQQLFRSVENGDVRSALVMGGLQTSIFGLNGLPMFNAINTHLVGNADMNPGHKDIFTYVTQAAGKDVGDWLLYGTASGLPIFGGQGPSLYTRGEIQPRHPTIIPTSPSEIPAVDGTIRFVSNLVDMGEKLMAGGNVGQTLLQGLAHNNINRPLAGLAQVLSGNSTTSDGSLVAQSNDLFSIATASRIIGAKPLDESIGLNQKFRSAQYGAVDKDRINVLGQVVKDKLRNGQSPSEDDIHDFMGQYAAAGGNVTNFSAQMQKWNKDANESVINNVTHTLRTARSQRMFEVMGGTRLPDGTPPPQVQQQTNDDQNQPSQPIQ